MNGWHGQTCLTVLARTYFATWTDTLKLRLGVAPKDVISYN